MKKKEKQDVVREHNRAQWDNVKKGKKPFYFKSGKHIIVVFLSVLKKNFL